MCFLLLFFVSFISCKKTEHNNQITAELPMGTWRVIDLKSPDKNIVFDTTRTYFLEHKISNFMRVHLLVKKLVINICQNYLNCCYAVKKVYFYRIICGDRI